ncbi:hypothetical protein C8Q78DRAFT_248803 [Trametes maxima]|nr:hypothetical protein C8Q78DRAFT_248803 [Trametes maxima]
MTLDSLPIELWEAILDVGVVMARDLVSFVRAASSYATRFGMKARVVQLHLFFLRRHATDERRIEGCGSAVAAASIRRRSRAPMSAGLRLDLALDARQRQLPSSLSPISTWRLWFPSFQPPLLGSERTRYALESARPFSAAYIVTVDLCVPALSKWSNRRDCSPCDRLAGLSMSPCSSVLRPHCPDLYLVSHVLKSPPICSIYARTARSGIEASYSIPKQSGVASPVPSPCVPVRGDRNERLPASRLFDAYRRADSFRGRPL